MLFMCVYAHTYQLHPNKTASKFKRQIKTIKKFLHHSVTLKNAFILKRQPAETQISFY